MGVDINSMFDKHSEYVSAVYEYVFNILITIIYVKLIFSFRKIHHFVFIYRISEITTKRAVSIWLHPDIIFQNVSIGKKYAKCLDILHGFTNKVNILYLFQ